jgi:hypothetical protein
LPGVVEDHSSLIQQYQRRRQRFFRQSTQEVLVAIFEGTCERVFGRTFALQAYPEYRDFFRRLAVPWQPTFLSAAPAPTTPSSPVSSPRTGAGSPVSASPRRSPSAGRLLPPRSQPSVSRAGRLIRSPRPYGSPDLSGPRAGTLAPGRGPRGAPPSRPARGRRGRGRSSAHHSFWSLGAHPVHREKTTVE